jgi:predicted nucleic acid-binding protein
VILADTNMLSTFAKIRELLLLLKLFRDERFGVVPAVHEELQNGVSKGYLGLQVVIELIQQGQIDLVVPNAEEIFAKGTLPKSFDEGERETIAVANSRAYQVLTNERLVKNWCKKIGRTYWDLPGILRAFWRTNLLTKEQVQRLVNEIEAKDRIVFKDKEQIFAE